MALLGAKEEKRERKVGKEGGVRRMRIEVKNL